MAFPGVPELDHAIIAIGAATFDLMVPHRHDRINSPDPRSIGAGEGLDADRPNFELAVVLGLQDHTVIIQGLGMLNFAEAEMVHTPMIPPMGRGGKPLVLGDGDEKDAKAEK